MQKELTRYVISHHHYTPFLHSHISPTAAVLPFSAVHATLPAQGDSNALTPTAPAVVIHFPHLLPRRHLVRFFRIVNAP